MAVEVETEIGAQPDPAGEVTDPLLPVTAFARNTFEAYHTLRHRHRRAQLVYASAGVMTVTTATGTWVVAPQQAVWVPAGTEHDVTARGPLALRSLYIDPASAVAMPDGCCVVDVRPLLRELILEAVCVLADQPHPGSATNLVALLLDELSRLQPVALHLPAPRDRRLLQITRALLDDPADTRTLAQWAIGSGAGERTLARLFVRDTGVSFGEWRTRLKILTAIERLALGRSVTEVAYDLGYASPSAFIARFRKTVGAPPAQYLRESRS